MARLMEVADNANELETQPEVRLWQAVIAKTVEEWVYGPLRRQQEAEKYLFDDRTDFRTACRMANMDCERLREKLLKCRKRGQLDGEARLSRN